MIRKLKSGKYRLYSINLNPKTKKRRNLGTFDTLESAKNTNKKYNILNTSIPKIQFVYQSELIAAIFVAASFLINDEHHCLL